MTRGSQRNSARYSRTARGDGFVGRAQVHQQDADAGRRAVRVIRCAEIRSHARAVDAKARTIPRPLHMTDAARRRGAGAADHTSRPRLDARREPQHEHLQQARHRAENEQGQRRVRRVHGHRLYADRADDLLQESQRARADAGVLGSQAYCGRRHVRHEQPLAKEMHGDRRENPDRMQQAERDERERRGCPTTCSTTPVTTIQCCPREARRPTPVAEHVADAR